MRRLRHAWKLYGVRQRMTAAHGGGFTRWQNWLIAWEYARGA